MKLGATLGTKTHFLVNWSTVWWLKQLGGLDIFKIEKFRRAMRLCWSWNAWTEPTRPRVSMGIPYDAKYMQSFRALHISLLTMVPSFFFTKIDRSMGMLWSFSLWRFLQWEHLLCNQPFRAIVQLNWHETSDPKPAARSKYVWFHLRLVCKFMKTPLHTSTVLYRAPILLHQISISLYTYLFT
jgi:hypothetical protein